jgi:hypothetical protein
MKLTSMRYLEPVHTLPLEKSTGCDELGWTEVSKGLFAVLSAYMLGILNGVGSVLLLWFSTSGFRVPVHEVKGDELSLMLVGGAVLFFSSLFSSFLLLRGKWRCMMNAPDRRSARWLMFASMMCIFAGPAINMASGLVGGSNAKMRSVEIETHPSAAKAAALYVEKLRESDLSAYMRLAGAIIAPFGPIFFVLFLRAVHNCLGGALGARLTELYLLFVVLLAAGTLSLALDSRVHIRSDLLMYLGVGWLVAIVWYFCLILGGVVSITAHVNSLRADRL